LDTLKEFETKLYTVNDSRFEDIALELFHFQAVHNPVYRHYLANLPVDISSIKQLDQIPFLPIRFFKSHDIRTGEWNPEIVFTSSGTTSSATSRHSIRDLRFYLNHSQRCFEYFFGPIDKFHLLALLPSYLEREGSSLIAMIDHFIKQTGSDYSDFYLSDLNELVRQLEILKGEKKRTILWGVSFALMDLAEKRNVDLEHCLVFETGGMKGRRKEIVRTELHKILKNSFHIRDVFSEYGMTELLSQAYTRGEARFFCPPWMKVAAREITDPFETGLLNETGGINVIDLANCHSVAFIETEDLGRVFGDGTFEVLGRADNSDVRGCNLLVE
jgi:phenylacetate-coenzyme A ligase PaaK-like adenylate-forming protein